MGGAVSQRRRPQLGADRRRRRLREPAQRRGHRLRPRDRPAGRRDAWPEHDDLAHGVAGAAARPLRRVVLDRPPAGRPGDRAAAAADARPGRHALGLADDAGAALDGQPGHRRGPRPRRPGVALGRAALAAPATTVRRSPEPRAPGRPLDSHDIGPWCRLTIVRRRSSRCAGSTSRPLARARSTCRPSGPVAAGQRARRPTPTSSSSAGRAGPRAARAVPVPPRRLGRAAGAAAAMDAMRHIPVDREAPAAAYLRARRLLARGRGGLRLPRGRHLVLVHGPGADARRGRAGPRDRRPGRAGRASGAASGSASVGRRSTAGGPRPDLRRGRAVDVRFGTPMPVAPGRRPGRPPPSARRAR